MADILDIMGRYRKALKQLSDTPAPIPTLRELQLVYKVFDTAKSLDDLPLFTRDVK